MIPAIAVMIGAYIVTRMFELLFKPESKTTINILAVLTIIIVIISIIDVLNAGSRGSRPF